MTEYVRHALKIQPTNDELARQGFMQGMRTYVMQTMAMGMQTVYERKVEPDFEKRNSRKPKDGHEVHQALINEAQFKFYSSLRCNAQEMTYRSVLPTIERNFESISRKAEELTQSMGKAKGTLHTDPSLQVPSYVTDVDVHHMAGNYDTEYVENDLIQGAVYDNGTSVFSMGLFGDEMDDIGTTLAQFINAKYPNFEPKRILDLGCTVGHNTVPWARTFPQAEVHGIDVCAPMVRYAHARAQALGETVHFHQQNAERMDFEAGSFDMIFSSMFLHELPVKSIRNVFKQAHRLLKPGGLMLHMELPGNEMLAPYDGFYIDWSAYYNKEPFMKAFRDMNAKELCTSTGFEPDNYFHYIVPSLRCYGEQAVLQSVDNQTGQGYEKAGRFADQVEWFCFGAWK
jgi:ubiquinone/menaquinone biosynthesis C-methylase UbiE